MVAERSGEIGVEDASDLREVSGDRDLQLIQPTLGKGDMLIYQYRVVHRSPKADVVRACACVGASLCVPCACAGGHESKRFQLSARW